TDLVPGFIAVPHSGGNSLRNRTIGSLPRRQRLACQGSRAARSILVASSRDHCPMREPEGESSGAVSSRGRQRLPLRALRELLLFASSHSSVHLACDSWNAGH